MNAGRQLSGIVSLIVTLWTACALADPVPSSVELPAGFSLGRTEYVRYGRLDIRVPSNLDTGANVHTEAVHGRLWHVQLTGDAGALQAHQWRAGLEHAGWRVARDDGGVLTARRDGRDGPVWLNAGNGLGFDVIETTPVPALTVPEPAAAPETLDATHPLPYLPPLAGMSIAEFRVEDRPEEMTGPLTDGPFFVGPPVTRLTYRGPHEIGGLEIQSAYPAALVAVGWTINYSHEGGETVAHYARRGRDIWLKFYGGPGEMFITVSDVGANATAARLRAAIEHDGHVAVRGIYFDTDRDVLRPDSETALQQVLALLREVPTLRLEVQGHTDNAGAHDRNQPLSEARAAAVVRWLTGHGITANRLTSAGYAETRPVAPNTSSQGRALNRRVELARPAVR